MLNGTTLIAKTNAPSGAWKMGDLAIFLDTYRPQVELVDPRLFAVGRIGFNSLRELERNFRQVN